MSASRTPVHYDKRPLAPPSRPPLRERRLLCVAQHNKVARRGRDARSRNRATAQRSQNTHVKQGAHPSGMRPTLLARPTPHLGTRTHKLRRIRVLSSRMSVKLTSVVRRDQVGDILVTSARRRQTMTVTNSFLRGRCWRRSWDLLCDAHSASRDASREESSNAPTVSARARNPGNAPR